MGRPQLTWSRGHARNTLGHYDPAHNAIVVSRIFDGVRVPRCAVEYILYHEMLHLKHPVKLRGSRRCIHGPEFQAEERQFPHLEEARQILRRYSAQFSDAFWNYRRAFLDGAFFAGVAFFAAFTGALSSLLRRLRRCSLFRCRLLRHFFLRRSFSRCSLDRYRLDRYRSRSLWQVPLFSPQQHLWQIPGASSGRRQAVS